MLLHRSLLLLALAAAPAPAATPLPIDASHTAVVLTWNHRGLSHPVARFEKVVGRINLDTDDLSRSSVEVTLPLDGLRTGDDDLNRRLKGPEFFDAARFPQITFRSTQVKKTGADTLDVAGEVHLRDSTRPVTLHVHVNSILSAAGKPTESGFDADAQLLRSDFGLGKYVPMVSDEVALHVTLEAHAD